MPVPCPDSREDTSVLRSKAWEMAVRTWALAHTPRLVRKPTNSMAEEAKS